MTTGELRYRERCITKLDYVFRGDERLLDVGCGDGGVARLLVRRVDEVVAIDVEPSDAWRDGDRVTYRVANGENLPFGDSQFDLVHSKDSLHHMQNPGLALAEYRRVLKPGGAALIVEGNRYNPVFYVHMTRMLGHEHFAQSYFHDLIARTFPGARFGAFEAHYAPFAERFLRFQQIAEETLERIPGFGRFASYNFAVALR
jgi:ubiquinone/menaquinone biosynthesis C-methylase UbiE